MGRFKNYRSMLCCKHDALCLSENLTILCLKLGIRCGSNAIRSNSISKVNLGKSLSPSLCSRPHEIDSLHQYVSHPTRALRSPGSHSSHPGSTDRLSRRPHPALPVISEVNVPCSHQYAFIGSALAHRAAHADRPIGAQRPFLDRGACAVSSELSSSHAIVTMIGLVQNRRIDNSTHPTLGGR